MGATGSPNGGDHGLQSRVLTASGERQTQSPVAWLFSQPTGMAMGYTSPDWSPLQRTFLPTRQD